jgi:cell division protein FtsL
MARNNSNRKKGNLAQVLGGDMLGSHFVLRQIPLLLMILAGCLVMVWVRYKVEGLNKEKSKLQKEVSYLREQRVQMQKQYQESIRISRIDRELDTIDVGLVAGPPFELKVDYK